jgi:hypothetical protein
MDQSLVTGHLAIYDHRLVCLVQFPHECAFVHGTSTSSTAGIVVSTNVQFFLSGLPNTG